MSKEFITWQKAAVALNKSNSHIPTDWPTKEQLLTMGAGSVPLQRYAITDFVAEEDVTLTLSNDIILSPVRVPETATFTDRGIVHGSHSYEYFESQFPVQVDPTGLNLRFKIETVGDVKGEITAIPINATDVNIQEIEMPPIGLRVIFDLVDCRPGSVHTFTILVEADGISTTLIVVIQAVEGTIE